MGRKTTAYGLLTGSLLLPVLGCSDENTCGTSSASTAGRVQTSGTILEVETLEAGDEVLVYVSQCPPEAGSQRPGNAEPEYDEDGCEVSDLVRLAWFSGVGQEYYVHLDPAEWGLQGLQPDYTIVAEACS